jgi:TetR/AcrR family transcriptional regulator, cholesterol catabolism regulator
MKKPSGLAKPSSKSTDMRRDILRSAAMLFDQSGFNAVTMDDIAREVGLAKPTLYYYFRSKDDILYELSHSAIVALIERLESREGLGLTSSQLILEAMVDVLEIAHSEPGWMRVLVEFQGDLTDERREAVGELRARYLAILEAILAEAMERREIRQVDVKMGTRAVFGMANWAYRWMSPDDDPRHVAYAFWDVAFNGLNPQRREGSS